ncbi:MAG TPA: hypothetical protein VEO00_10630 [Actinomycetota bacterium]|nr:hypothetical protein [Actinomycetota bacterium]
MAATGEGDVGRASELMAKAFRSLARPEQDEVLRALFAATLGAVAGGGMRLGYAAGPPGPLPQLPTPLDPQADVLFLRSATAGIRTLPPAGGEMQMVPMRLPEPQYQAFRRWCQEHSFSMAAVMRGLVESFLEKQAVAQVTPPKRTAPRKRATRSSSERAGPKPPAARRRTRSAAKRAPRRSP